MGPANSNVRGNIGQTLLAPGDCRRPGGLRTSDAWHVPDKLPRMNGGPDSMHNLEGTATNGNQTPVGDRGGP